MYNNKKIFTLSAVVLIAVLGFAVYFNSLNGKFIWDDDDLVKNNVYIRDWSCLGNIFTEDIASGSDKEYSFYRPLHIITNIIDYSLWKLNEKGYHFTNIVLHILAALTIYWFINILFSNKPLSLVTSLLFVVNPLHTETVAYISGRADSLLILFTLLCFIFYIKYLHKKNKIIYVLMILSYMAALLSKESALILPVLLLLYHYTFRQKIKTSQFLPLVSLTLIYILLRLEILRFFLPHSHLLRPTTFFQRVPGFFVAITNYVRLLFLPLDLHMEYGRKFFSFSDPRALLGIAAIFLLLIYGVKKRNSNRVVFFSIFWFFIALIPVSNFYPIIAYMAEHWLYLPSIGFFLILAKALTSIYEVKKYRIVSIALLASLLTFYSFTTIKQNHYWKEPLVFYERTLQFAPDSLRTLLSLGIIHNDMGDKEKAIIFFNNAAEARPDCSLSYYNLGNTYSEMAKMNEAIVYYQKSIELDPDYAKAYYNLGNTYSKTGEINEAIASYKKAVEIEPGYVKAHYNLGNAYSRIGKIREAIASYEKALEINPDSPKIYNNLGIVYRKIGEYEYAIDSYMRAIEIKPDYAQAYYNLALIYFDQEQYKLAIVYFDKAKSLGVTNTAFAEALKIYRQEGI